MCDVITPIFNILLLGEYFQKWTIRWKLPSYFFTDFRSYLATCPRELWSESCRDAETFPMHSRECKHARTASAFVRASQFWIITYTCYRTTAAAVECKQREARWKIKRQRLFSIYICLQVYYKHTTASNVCLHRASVITRHAAVNNKGARRIIKYLFQPATHWWIIKYQPSFAF